MTLTRLLPLQLHAAIEAALAPAVIVFAFLLGFSPPLLVGAVVLGGLLMGSALHASAGPPRVSAHINLDFAIAMTAIGLVLGAVLTGDLAAAAFFLIVGAIEGALTTTTRYTEAGR